MAAAAIFKITILAVSRPFLHNICTEFDTETKDAVMQPDLTSKLYSVYSAIVRGIGQTPCSFEHVSCLFQTPRSINR